MVVNVSDTEAYLFSDNVALRRKYNKDVAHLSSEIHRLVDLIDKDRKTIKTLQEKVENLKGIVEERTDALIIEANVRESETVKSFYLQTYLKIYYRIAQELMQRDPTRLGSSEISNIFSEAERISSIKTISFLQMRKPEIFNLVSADELIKMTTKTEKSEKEND